MRWWNDRQIDGEIRWVIIEKIGSFFLETPYWVGQEIVGFVTENDLAGAKIYDLYQSEAFSFELSLEIEMSNDHCLYDIDILNRIKGKNLFNIISFNG